MPAPSPSTIKRLFLLTENRCAFPGCNRMLVDDSGILIAEVCHICADKPGGKRYDPAQSEAKRQSYENLIVLCPNHHTLVDGDENTFTADVLRDMKRRHEARAAKKFIISDKLATRIAFLLGGMAIGAGIGEMVREVRDVARTMSEAIAPASPEAKFFRRGLGRILRYAPKGVLLYFSRDPTNLQIGSFFIEIFKAAGWRIEKLADDRHLRWERRVDYQRGMLLFFSMSDRNQVPNGRQAIDEVFRKCGFTVAHNDDKYEAADKERGTRITFYLIVRARRSSM